LASVAIALQRNARAVCGAAAGVQRAFRRNYAGNWPNNERGALTGRSCTRKLKLSNGHSASACNRHRNLIYISKVENFLRDRPFSKRDARGSATGARMERTNVGIESRYMSWQPANDFHRGVPPL
jgi:hypothetical protein